MNTQILFLATMSVFLLSSCSNHIQPSPLKEKAVIPQANPTEEVVFKYNESRSSKIDLNSTPADTSLGYARVAGIAYGKNISAIIEIGGKGVIVCEKDKIGEYFVNKISEKGVTLCLKR